MNRIKIAAIGFVIVIGVCINLNAGPIADAINDHIIATFDFDPKMTEIECRPEIDTITLSDSTEIIISCREYPAPRGYFPIKVLLQDGSGSIRTISTSIDVSHFQNVLVAKKRVRSREQTSQLDFTIERVEVNKVIGNPVKDFAPLDGMQASKTISKGKILTEEMLEPIPVVRRGERVKILYKSNSLKVEAYGIARKDAIEGEMVEVKNTDSGQKIYGRAASDGVVIVER